MVSVAAGKARKNPKFYVFSHLARFIKPGAVLLDVGGDWAGSAVAARNTNGEVAIMVMNPHAKARKFRYEDGESIKGKKAFAFDVELAPLSLNSFLVPDLTRKPKLMKK